MKHQNRTLHTITVVLALVLLLTCCTGAVMATPPVLLKDSLGVGSAQGTSGDTSGGTTEGTTGGTTGGTTSGTTGGTGFTFRNGITWNTTYDQMLQIEGNAVSPSSSYNLLVCRLFGIQTEYEKLDVLYYYMNGMLVACGNYYPKSAFDFETRKNLISQQYGQPAEEDAYSAGVVLNMLSIGCLNKQAMPPYCGWVLPDGTLAFLYDFGANQGFYFFNSFFIAPKPD